LILSFFGQMSCPEIWLQVKLAIIFGLALALAIPSGFGRSRIRRPEHAVRTGEANCGYTLL